MIYGKRFLFNPVLFDQKRNMMVNADRSFAGLLSPHFCMILLVAVMMTGCRKNVDAPSSTAPAIPSMEPPAELIITPSDGDERTDPESEIRISRNKSAKAFKIRYIDFTLRKDGNIVQGMEDITDTSIVFLPSASLEPYSTYIATLSAWVFVFHRGQPVTRKKIDYSWHFTTDGPTVYTMSKRSSRVTDFLRDGNMAIQMGDHLYSYGGWNGWMEDSFNDVYRSAGDLSVWEKMPDAPWHPRHTFGIGKINGDLYVFGGDHLHDVFDVWRSRDGINFVCVNEDLGETVGSRLLYGACAHNDQLFVLGGQADLGPDAGLTDVWSSANGVDWRQIARDLDFLGKNISGAVVSFANKLWVIGGGYYGHPDDARRWTNHVYSSPDGISWTREQDAPWIGRQYANVCVWDNKLWMVAGTNAANLADIWHMSKDGEWTRFDAPPDFEARHASGLAVYNDQLVIVCGNMHNDCWVIEKTRV